MSRSKIHDFHHADFFGFSDISFCEILRKNAAYVSILRTTESVVAIYVSTMPIGRRINEESHIPPIEEIWFSFTSFSPERLIT